jgi:hypothetical protein
MTSLCVADTFECWYRLPYCKCVLLHLALRFFGAAEVATYMCLLLTTCNKTTLKWRS